MVPEKLDDWTLPTIEGLLVRRYMEQETFDYKQKLPDRKDSAGKKRLRKDCCAFSNASGGFLVFGVHDDTKLPVTDRLIGFDPHYDFPVDFGSYPSNCNPTVRWEIRNPPITLPGGNVLHVVWFPPSWHAPHSIGTPEEGLVFPKRTNRGTEHMSYEETRMMFLGYYERRIKLQLLHSEILNLKNDAKDMVLPQDQWRASVSLVTLRMDTIESVLVDTFVLIKESMPLMVMLTNIRNRARNINNRVALIHPVIHMPLSYKDQLFADHNQWIEEHSTLLGKEAEGALEIMERLLGAP